MKLEIPNKKESIKSWNNTIKKKAIVFYPKDILQLKKLINFCKKNKKNYLIRTGSCSYDSKSINPNLDTYVISLRSFNKILKINIKKKFINVQAGCLISDVIKEIKDKLVTLYSVPGGENISIGGAISANTIGKDSSPEIASFGDSLMSLQFLSSEGKIKKISQNNKKLNNFVGAFGNEGIILEAKIKIKKIISKNLLVTSKILKNLKEVTSELKLKTDYHYIQIDPFFRKNHFAISFKAHSTKLNKNIYKNINLKIFKLEEYLFHFFGFFINNFTWKIFYKIFFIFNKNMKKYSDIHNFHYGSKYKHLIPLVCKDGLLDFEILIKNNFNNSMRNLIDFLKKEKIYPMYIIVKKLYKSKNNYCYKFNENGFAVAISINKSLINLETLTSFENLLKKKKLKLNLSKTDKKFINLKKNNNFLFLSLYKKMLLEQNGISRTRIRKF